MNTAEQLARIILQADLPKRLVAENEKLCAALLECKHGAEYSDELGDLIDKALEPEPEKRFHFAREFWEGMAALS